MAGTITKLEIQKRNKERVNVYLDEQFVLGVMLSVAVELKKGQFLSDADIERLKQQDNRHKAYQRALNYLSFRSRSRVEIERYLREKKVAPDIITATIERLDEEGLIDDSAFAESWVENRERLKPKGARALRYELQQKGLNESTIDSALEQIDESELAWRAIEKKVRQWQALDEADFKRKAMAFLSRRGFDYEVTMETVERAWQTSNSEQTE
ncbi:MAG: RecX family transcriptional regulator [Anaerolineaceae bacterium]|nr:RecX family transcriptional regulator [Anaerolineaceae bacterium]MCB9099019.1 RecX family transcriptional regulator [Anaerolineales bacterium]